jgi:hypothetical protein
MNKNEIILELEKEWAVPNGLFYQLRYNGDFDVQKYERFVELLHSIKIEGEEINRKLVSLLWYLPLFMTWQKERVIENGGNIKKLESAIDEVISILEEKLGVP